jgi:hypothetical protein
MFPRTRTSVAVLLVKNLLTTDTSKYQFTAEVFAAGGQTAAAHNAINATIFALGTLINRDPELVKELESSRPELQKGLEFMQEGRVERAAQNQTAGRPPVRQAFCQTHNHQSMYEELCYISRMQAGRQTQGPESHAHYRCPSIC